MTKLSKRMPNSNYDYEDWVDWFKELAEYAEFIDRHDRLAYRDLRERLDQISECERGTVHHRRHYDYCHPTSYQPQTYDEAIALIKGWKRCVVDMFVHWETPKGAWWVIDPNDKVGFCEADYENYNFSWERDKWTDLWQEMVDGKMRRLYLSEISDEWVFNLASIMYTDSTPGRVVCKAYLVYKGHTDWAERLSKVKCDSGSSCSYKRREHEKL